MSEYTGAGELTKRRQWPDEDYAYPDGRNARIAQLEGLLLEVLRTLPAWGQDALHARVDAALAERRT